MMNRKGLFN